MWRNVDQINSFQSNISSIGIYTKFERDQPFCRGFVSVFPFFSLSSLSRSLSLPIRIGSLSAYFKILILVKWFYILFHRFDYIDSGARVSNHSLVSRIIYLLKSRLAPTLRSPFLISFLSRLLLSLESMNNSVWICKTTWNLFNSLFYYRKITNKHICKHYGPCMCAFTHSTACDLPHTPKMLSLRKENGQRRIERKNKREAKKNPNFICIQSHINNFQNLKTINLVSDEFSLIVVHRVFCLCYRWFLFSSLYRFAPVLSAYSPPRVGLSIKFW